MILLCSNEFKVIKDSLPLGANLLAVSKGHDHELIRKLYGYGQLDFGESRLQEAIPKKSDLNDLKQIRWHFVGKLQKNKVRGVIKEFDFIHSVDSLPLLERISRISKEEQKSPNIFLQVKFKDDPNKGGFLKQDLLKSWSKIISLNNINLIGLMTIPPIALNSYQRKDLFCECRDFANHLGLKDCSMGMSNDWQEAIKAGTTWIRLGSILFGKRQI
ncbi:YggS family pyridoxal phosphate-dependent enzyme [Prochlorococcus marinus]|uniref:YggS family pyridoxal phosphate-dependent enzyme n=1 Tax=Prochlorococcus marinus TaxID=1219 RepID=UPI0022B2BF83|nr:YggS family pyridoxal phosphate-dependent enzyme [Prochlorococcus marinus]